MKSSYSVAGLLMNLFLMWLLYRQFGIQNMLAKIIATGVVFVYNYQRKKFPYEEIGWSSRKHIKE